MQAALRRLLALLALFSAVASVCLAGQSVFRCPWMQKSAASCCCPTERAGAEGPAISRAPCCSRTTLAATPGAPTDSSRQTTSVPGATAFVGELVRVADDFDRTTRVASAEREHGARAGPNAELFELHSAYLI